MLARAADRSRTWDVAVVGGGNSAAEESLLLTKFADHVTILVRGDAFTASQVIVDKVLENQAALMRSARIVPEQKDGKVVGIRMFGIRKDTLLGTLGFQNGDRLENINGFDMTSPEKALEAYARLRTAGNLKVQITRRGKPVTVDFRIK